MASVTSNFHPKDYSIFVYFLDNFYDASPTVWFLDNFYDASPTVWFYSVK